MQKVQTFWNGIFDFCNPIIAVKKFRIAKTRLKPNLGKIKLIKNQHVNFRNENKLVGNFLYTTFGMSDYRHKIKKEKNEKMKEFMELNKQFQIC